MLSPNVSNYKRETKSFFTFLGVFCFKYIVLENVGDRDANNTLFAISYHETLSFSFIFVGGNLSFCKFCQKSFL